MWRSRKATTIYCVLWTSIQAYYGIVKNNLVKFITKFHDMEFRVRIHYLQPLRYVVKYRKEGEYMSYRSNQEWSPRPIPPENDPYEIGFEDKLYEDAFTEEAEKEVFSIPERPSVSERKVNQYYEPPEKSRKKHRFLKFILKTLLFLLLAVILAAAALHFFSHEPMHRSAGRKDDCCTVLLVGEDLESNNTDTLMLMQIDRTKRSINIMSIPRDTKVNSSYTPHKINAAYAANGCGEEGMEALMDYTADCIGFRPDGYILVDLAVFIDLVDLFGGVDFDVPVDMYYDDPAQDLHIALPAGLRELDGEQAMGLVRFRSGYADADIGRIRVQRDFMKEAIDQWATPVNILKLPVALWKLGKRCTTDMSLTELYWLAESAVVCGTDSMYTAVMPFYFKDIYVCVDLDGDYLDLINAYFNPYTEPVTWDDFNIAY